jgi:pyruvate kinase
VAKRRWSPRELGELIRQLTELRHELVADEERYARRIAGVAAPHRASARNLVHYLALRRHDMRSLQERLAALGLSSLGRMEGHALSSVDAVLAVLHAMSGTLLPARRPPRALDFTAGSALLEARTEALLGPAPPQRDVRIMVTMPEEAADDAALVRELLALGMDCMRINCAHDGEVEWRRMLQHLRKARLQLRRPCRVLMDLGGPKLRTGMLAGDAVRLRVAPEKDADGALTKPARLWLTRLESPEPAPPTASAVLLAPSRWLARLHTGESLALVEARGKKRELRCGPELGPSRWLELDKGAELPLDRPVELVRLAPRGGKARTEARVAAGPASDVFLPLRPGDRLLLCRPEALPQPGRSVLREAPTAFPRVACAQPEVVSALRRGQRVFFDDGRLMGVVRTPSFDAPEIEIMQALGKGDRLRSGKGINLPDTELRVPALSDKDLVDLDFVARHADLVGLSFANRPEDVRALDAELRKRAKRPPGIVLKIETKGGFERLPGLLFAALESAPFGVMIARGDLAVELGYERMAEVQEEILWLCEAAHAPVIWATQVLENMAKTGFPSRAEITDAAMGERAECVMLNKGPHVREAVTALDDILRRMEAHQHKKSAMLRRLHLRPLETE